MLPSLLRLKTSYTIVPCEDTAGLRINNEQRALN